MTPTTETGVGLIAAERRRQRFEEGWTDEHDATHDSGELAAAAVTYARLAGWPPENAVAMVANGDVFWPFSKEWYKPTTQLGNLVKAGALIAAEIDRLLRIENSKTVLGA